MQNGYSKIIKPEKKCITDYAFYWGFVQRPAVILDLCQCCGIFHLANYFSAKILAIAIEVCQVSWLYHTLQNGYSKNIDWDPKIPHIDILGVGVRISLIAAVLVSQTK